MKTFQRAILIAIVVLTILSLLLSACGPIDTLNNGKDRDKDKDHGNGNDKNKDKENGDRDDQDEAAKAEKILICHKTGSAKNPYVQISVAGNAVKNGHGKHEGDIIPAPEGGCPDTWIVTDVPAN